MPRFLTGDEPIPDVGATVHEFWAWALADSFTNNARGVFAEWLVARVLGLSPSHRVEWDDWDLELDDGTCIEVKTAGLIQAWDPGPSGRSKPRFAGLRKRRFIAEEFRYATEPTYNADLYVFCFQNHDDEESYDLLALEQWDFWVLGRQQLEELGQDSIGHARLGELAGPGLSWDQLAATINRLRPRVNKE